MKSNLLLKIFTTIAAVALSEFCFSDGMKVAKVGAYEYSYFIGTNGKFGE